MKNQKKLLSLLLSALMLVGSVYMPSLAVYAQDGTQASLVVTDMETKLEVTSDGGTLDQMLSKASTMMASTENAQKQYAYDITLNEAASFSAVEFTAANPNTYLNLDFAGYAVSYSGATDAIITKGGVQLSIDGKGATLTHSGDSGRLIYVSETADIETDSDAEAVTNVSNLKVDVTGMSSAPGSFISVGFGDATFKNTNITYKGSATASELNMIYYSGYRKFLVDGCSIVDETKTKTVGVYVGGSANTNTKALIKDSTISGDFAVRVSNYQLNIYAVNSKLTGVSAVNGNKGIVNYYDCVLIVDGENGFVNGDKKPEAAMLYSTAGLAGDSNTIIYIKGEIDDATSKYCKLASAMSFNELTTDKAGYSKFEIKPSASCEAVGYALKADNTVWYASGTFSNVLSSTGTEKLTGCELAEGEDAMVTVLKDLTASSEINMYAELPDSKFIIKLNGHKISFSGTNTRYIKLYKRLDLVIDGAGTSGNSLVENKVATGNSHFVVLMGSTNGDTNSNLQLKNIEFSYSAKPNMVEINKGNSMQLENVKASYTGTVSGTMFYTAGGGGVKLDGCDILASSAGTATAILTMARAYINNSKISSHIAINFASAPVASYVKNSTIYAYDTAFKGVSSSSSMYILNTDVKTDNAIVDAAPASAGKLVFVYADGSRSITSPSEPADTLAQPGYVFENTDGNVWKMKASGEYDYTTAIIPESGAAQFTDEISLPPKTPTANTVYYINAGKDNASGMTGKIIETNDKATVYIDFDGFDISSSSVFITLRDTPKVYIDGANRDNTKNTTFTANGEFPFLRCYTGSPAVAVSNINLKYKVSAKRMLELYGGSYDFDGVNIEYTGENATAPGEGHFLFINGDTDISFKNGKLIDSNNIGYTNVYSVYFGGSDKGSSVYMENTKISTKGMAFHLRETSKLDLKGCTVKSGLYCYSMIGNDNASAVDTKYDIGNGNFIEEVGKLKLSGNSSINQNIVKDISGGIEVPEGYELFTPDYKSWEVSNGLGFCLHNVTGTDKSYTYSVKVSACGNEQNGVLIVALYDNANTLVGLDTIDIQNKASHTESDKAIYTTADASSYKIMFLNELGALTPLCINARGSVMEN